jgi:xylan 1,4-beta-xylosidase
MAGFLDEKGEAGTVLSPNRDEVIAQVKHSRSQIAASALPGLELHYTEWSSSYTPADPMHDSYHSAAFILNKIKGIGSDAQSMSYWTFTDVFEEVGPRWSAFHGGFGLLNYQGIRKPAFYAYQFMHRLGDIELATIDPDAWVTKKADGSVQALFWDFTLTHPGMKVNNQVFYNKDQPSLPTKPVLLSLAGLKPGSYQLIAYKVGYRSNDAYTGYLDMGSPAQLTRAQVARLKDASDGRSYLSEQVVVGSEGKLTRLFELRQNDAILVELRQ